MTLLVCYTPLHVLIAERLLAEGHITRFVLVFICFENTSTSRSYFQRLAARAEYARLEVMSRRPWQDAYRLTRLWRRLRRYEYTQFATGNLKHTHSRLLLRLAGNLRLTTFDDGSGSISQAGYFYQQSEARLSRAFFTLAGPSHLYKNITSSIDTHFTIYDAPGVYARKARIVQRIELLEQAELKPGAAQVTTIYLGNAFSQDGLCDPHYESELDTYIASKYPLDIVVPHPRSNPAALARLSKYAPIKSGSIAEEVVLSVLAKGSRARVIGAYSSALLNLVHIAGISLINVCCHLLKPTAHLERIMESSGVTMDRGYVKSPQELAL